MSEFSETLKSWRKARRFSQLELANEAEISGRHLSFLETGRARPSRGMVLRLSEALGLPLDARNRFLTKAGFAARYANHEWSDLEMTPVRDAVDRMLSQHMPYPGIAVDRLWRIVNANPTAERLFQHFNTGIGDSMLDLMMSDVMAGVIENWTEVAHAAASRLRVESLAQGGVPELDRASAHLASFGRLAEYPKSPVIPTIVLLGSTRLSMFATIAQFGTPEEVALDHIKVELYFPNDQATARVFEEMAAG